MKKYVGFKAEQVKEAWERMKILGIYGQARKEFLDGKLNKSEHGGILYWLDEEEQKQVKKFEEENEATVYHVILSRTGVIGTLYTYLFVSKHKEEWESEREDLKQGETIAYVYNQDDDICSEFGYVGIRQSFGGLVRTY